MGGGDGDGEETVPSAEVSDKKGEISCTVAETNRIRAELGLKPLRVDDTTAEGKPKESKRARAEKRERAEKKAREAEELKERVAQAKKKRLLKAKVAGDTLGDADEAGGSTADWLQRTREAAEKRQQKKQREASVDAAAPRRDGDGDDDLRGLRVAHDMEELADAGGDVVLTLKDSGVIDADTGHLADDVDELENTRMAATERDEERMAAKHKKKRPRLGGLEEMEAEQGKGVLEKYDAVLEEVGLAKKTKRAAKAVLGGGGTLMDVDGSGAAGGKRGASMGGAVATKKALDAAVNERLREEKDKESANFTAFKPMQDYYTAEEYEGLELNKGEKKKKTKKTKKDRKDKQDKKKNKKKKKKKSSKSEKEAMDQSDDGKKEEEEDEEEESAVLVRRIPTQQRGRSKITDNDDGEDGRDVAIKLLSRPAAGVAVTSVDDVARMVLQGRDERNGGDDEDEADSDDDDDRLVLDSTAAFSSEMEARAEERADDDERKEADKELRRKAEHKAERKAAKRKAKKAKSSDGDGDVDMDGGRANRPSVHEILAGPDIAGAKEASAESGLSAAIRSMTSREGLSSSSRAETNALNSVIVGRARDAKPFVDDGVGDVKYEHRDELGRLMTPKEAFRQVAYAFHGQKPGFKAQEKRRRDLERQQRILKAGSSEATTLQNLKKHQEDTGSAHVRL